MTCKYSAMKDGKIICTKDYPVQIMKCLKGGLACYKERKKMNPEPLCKASAVVAFLIGCALEGGGLSAGQAAAALLPVVGLLAWSFSLKAGYEIKKPLQMLRTSSKGQK